LALAAVLRHPQALLAPQPLRALAIELPALLKQQLMRAPVPPARAVARDLPERRPHPSIITGNHRRPALC
jgi:hypothetical protein